jgi:hypothetical protein
VFFWEHRCYVTLVAAGKVIEGVQLSKQRWRPDAPKGVFPGGMFSGVDGWLTHFARYDTDFQGLVG